VKLYARKTPTDYDFCQYYRPENDACDPSDAYVPSNVAVKCTGNASYVYGNFEYESTIVTELNLVCDDEFKVKTL
jgi:hypothetical protein